VEGLPSRKQQVQSIVLFELPKEPRHIVDTARQSQERLSSRSQAKVRQQATNTTSKLLAGVGTGNWVGANKMSLGSKL
jgi:hypothetical protein